MKRILLCSILLLLGLVLPGWSQDRVITGKVVTSEDNSSIPGVSVTIKGTTRGAVTDPNGDYKIISYALGQLEITVSQDILSESTRELLIAAVDV